MKKVTKTTRRTNNVKNKTGYVAGQSTGNKFLDALKEIDNYSYTQNGAVALDSTGDYMLDAYSQLPLRARATESEILGLFVPAFEKDHALGMKLLFWLRDCRESVGQRRVFRVCMRYIANRYPELVIGNFDNIMFFGRGDDYWCLIGTKVEEEMFKYISNILIQDMSEFIEMDKNV